MYMYILFFLSYLFPPVLGKNDAVYPRPSRDTSYLYCNRNKNRQRPASKTVYICDFFLSK